MKLHPLIAGAVVTVILSWAAWVSLSVSGLERKVDVLLDRSAPRHTASVTNPH